MNISIKSRIYLAFFVLIIIFVITTAISVYIIRSNRNQSFTIEKVINPESNAINELNKLILESKMYSTNWVFLRSNYEDKVSLETIISKQYPKLKTTLREYSELQNVKPITDSLELVFRKINLLQEKQQIIMKTLNSFESYDDAFTRLEMEVLLEDEVIPIVSELSASINRIIKQEESL